MSKIVQEIEIYFSSALNSNLNKISQGVNSVETYSATINLGNGRYGFQFGAVDIDTFIIVSGRDDDSYKGGIYVGGISWGSFDSIYYSTHNDGVIEVYSVSATMITMSVNWSYGDIKVTQLGCLNRGW